LQQDLPQEGSRAKTFLSPQSCGTPITDPSASNRLSRRVWNRLGLAYLDLYLAHTPFAFQPGDDQDPRDQNGNVLYDHGVTLLDTWKAMESLVDHGKCRAIGLSDITLDGLKPIYEAARIKPAAVQVESHPYLPETELLEFCKEKGIVFLAFAPLGPRDEAGTARRYSHLGYRAASWKDAGTGAVGLGGTAGHGFAYNAQDCGPRARKFRHLGLPGDALDEINRNSDSTETEFSGENGRAGFYSTREDDHEFEAGA